MAWGYNRSCYAPSDINFIGQDYNFTIEKVKAKDFPSEFKPKVYFGLASFSIPQYNYRVGYFLSDKWSVSLGLDHMKYVMNPNQTLNVSGSIEDTNSIYQGDLNDAYLISSDFLTFEHTDGLNYLSAELDRHVQIWMHANQKHFFNLFYGAGFGLVIPRSDVQLFGNPGANEFHTAGTGISIQGGFKAIFWKRLFVNGTAKAGIIRMHDILTTKQREKAKQTISFLQGYWQLGYRFSLMGNLKKVKNQD